MAASTTKKALIRRFDREPLHAFLHLHQYLQATGIELLTPAGTISYINYNEIKTICFVKEFESDEEPAKVFNTRPKMDGLWIRMTFRDGDVMDGILSNDLLQWDQYGFSVVPPEPYSNNQKVFVPRAALTEIHVLGVVGSPLTKVRRAKAVSKDQGRLFE